MSAGGAFGGSRGYQPRAPEKGVFPLDHFGECKQVGNQVFLPCQHLIAGVIAIGGNPAGVARLPGMPQGQCWRCFEMPRPVQALFTVPYGQVT